VSLVSREPSRSRRPTRSAKPKSLNGAIEGRHSLLQAGARMRVWLWLDVRLAGDDAKARFGENLT
jgi:hypothetical protein